MASKTLRERFIAGFEAIPGYKRVQTRSDKFVVFTKDRCRYYFIGRSGALRTGRTASESIPCSDAFKKLVLSVDTSEEARTVARSNYGRKYLELAALLPIQEDK